MELFVEHILVEVSNDKGDDDFAQCFWVDVDDLSAFLKLCRENNKYVKIEIDYSTAMAIKEN
jgi:hypothetical protein